MFGCMFGSTIFVSLPSKEVPGRFSGSPPTSQTTRHRSRTPKSDDARLGPGELVEIKISRLGRGGQHQSAKTHKGMSNGSTINCRAIL